MMMLVLVMVMMMRDDDDDAGDGDGVDKWANDDDHFNYDDNMFFLLIFYWGEVVKFQFEIRP